MLLKDCFQRLEPTVSGGDDFFRVCFPYEWLCTVSVIFLDEAIDSGLQLDGRVERTMLEPAACQFRNVAFDYMKP
jgi:hypothetical protein